MDKGEYFYCPKIDLSKVSFTEDLLRRLPAALALRYRVLPLYGDEFTVRIAMADPSDLDTLDALHHLLKRDIEPHVADEKQLEEYVQRLYGGTGG